MLLLVHPPTHPPANPPGKYTRSGNRGGGGVGGGGQQAHDHPYEIMFQNYLGGTVLQLQLSISLNCNLGIKQYISIYIYNV